MDICIYVKFFFFVFPSKVSLYLLCVLYWKVKGKDEKNTIRHKAETAVGGKGSGNGFVAQRRF